MAMRSAKMKAITPPKLMPPDHSAAARGTLPIEQTKLMMAMRGPTRAFSRLVQNPWPWMNNTFHTLSGTSTARNPATVYPITSSLRSIVTSATE